MYCQHCYLNPDVDAVKREVWHFRLLDCSLRELPQCIQWLARRSLIANSRQCCMCQQPMRFIAYIKGLDKKRWSCHTCQQTLSLRNGSFFERSNLSLVDIVLLIYVWVKDLPQTFAIEELSLNKNTVVDWFNFCRDECTKFVLKNNGSLLQLSYLLNLCYFIYPETLNRHQWCSVHPCRPRLMKNLPPQFPFTMTQLILFRPLKSATSSFFTSSREVSPSLTFLNYLWNDKGSLDFDFSVHFVCLTVHNPSQSSQGLCIIYLTCDKWDLLLT